MGYGAYSHEAHQALLHRRRGLSREQVFTQRGVHPLMNPKGVKVRESRDSEDHPRSQGIVFALDVTGSMGHIPHLLATQRLPDFMKIILGCGIQDPQVLFLAIGDATSDRAPLQVGQFESTAELMDQWLTWTFLEGGGGGTGEESYELALYFLALHTEMDCWVKRRKKGYLFITGDERPYPVLSRHVVEAVIGDSLDEDVPVEEVLAEVTQTYTPFFIIPDPERRDSRGAERAWRNLIGDHTLVLASPHDMCYAAAGVLALSERLVTSLDELADLLVETGMEPDRRGPVIRSLQRFAASLSP